MCDISPGVRGNGKQWPRLPGDAAAVTAEQQHGHFPQCPPYWSADSPPSFLSLPPFPSIAPLAAPTLYSALALHFRAIQVVPPRHYLREIRRDQKVASLILPRPSGWDIINNPTSPREFIYSVFSHVLTIRRLVKCCDDISLYRSEYICRVMVEMLLTLPTQMMARHCSLISAQHVLISMNV